MITVIYPKNEQKLHHFAALDIGQVFQYGTALYMKMEPTSPYKKGKNAVNLIDGTTHELQQETQVKKVKLKCEIEEIPEYDYDDEGRPINLPCPKGGFHTWGIDGQHLNQFCKKCFIDLPK